MLLKYIYIHNRVFNFILYIIIEFLRICTFNFCMWITIFAIKFEYYSLVRISNNHKPIIIFRFI